MSDGEAANDISRCPRCKSPVVAGVYRCRMCGALINDLAEPEQSSLAGKSSLLNFLLVTVLTGIICFYFVNR